MTDALSTAQPFVCGGLSACFASSIVHPIDLAKVRLQLFAVEHAGKPRPTFPEIITTMVKREGFASIYSGLSAALARQCVYGTARIGLHRTFSDYLQKKNEGKPLNFGYKALSGMGSGSLAVCLGTPFDVALVRMQADSMKSATERRGYKNVFDALIRVAKEEGFMKLYRELGEYLLQILKRLFHYYDSGLAPNILRGMSINVGMLACYDQAKESLGTYVFQDPQNMPASTQTQLGASLIAGFTATACSLPFDLLKSRMQDGSRYKGLSDAVLKIYTNEGLLSFWTGFGAYYMRTAPHAMIILMTTQPITDYYKKSFKL